METKEIIENNKLIALFMGIEVNDNNVLIPYHFANEHINRLPKEGGFFEGDLSDLGYHYDWNLLMPVVEKISEYRLAYPDQANEVCNCKIVIGLPFIYGKIIEFIKWYNLNTKANGN